MDDDLQYKEYKAQVPPRWAQFDKHGGTKRGGFVGFMKAAISANNVQVETVAGHGVGDDDEGVWGEGGDIDGGGNTKKRRTWLEEMTAYCRAQELKAQAKAQSAQLEAQLRKRQQRANSRREKALAAATSVPSASSMALSKASEQASASQHPSDTICAAMELETSRLVNTYEERVISRFEQREATLVRHLNQAKEKRASVRSAMMERSQFLHQVTNENETKAQRRFRENQEKKRLRIEKEIKESEIRSSALEERLRISREELNKRRAEMREEVDRKIDASLKAREEKRAAYEIALHQQIEATNQRLLESKIAHEVEVAEDKVGKALARAHEERARQRAAQLASCERSQRHRERAIREKEQHDAEFQQAWVDRNRSRASRVDTNVSRIYDKTMSMNLSIIERAHSPAMNRSTLSPIPIGGGGDRSVAEDVQAHRERFEQQQLAKLEQMLELEQEEFEHEKRFQVRRKAELDALAKKREQRLIALANAKQSAEDAARARAERIEKDVSDRQRKSEKALEELRSMACDSRHTMNEEKTRKAKEALELVNVTQRQELLEATNQKDERIRAASVAREAERMVRLQQEQEAQMRRWEETREHIRAVQEAREEKLEENLRHKELQRERAAMQRDERTLLLQKSLQEEAAARAATIAAKEAAAAEQLEKKRRELDAKDAAWKSSRAEQLRQEYDYLSNRALQRDARTAKAHAGMDKHRAEHTNHTIAKLQDVYDRRTPSLPRHLCFTPPPQRPHSSMK